MRLDIVGFVRSVLGDEQTCVAALWPIAAWVGMSAAESGVVSASQLSTAGVLGSLAHDEDEIDAVMSAFFAAYTSPLDDQQVDLSALRELFLPGAIIVAITDGDIKRYDVESFVAPRETLLNSGRLQEFSEREVVTETRVFGEIAQRWSLYGKSGSFDGQWSEGWGRKGAQLVRTPAGWRISSIVWQDGAPVSTAKLRSPLVAN